MFVEAAAVNPTIGPASFVVNIIERGVARTQAGHDVVYKLNGRDGMTCQIRFHTNSQAQGERLPEEVFTTLRLAAQYKNYHGADQGWSINKRTCTVTAKAGAKISTPV